LSSGTTGLGDGKVGADPARAICCLRILARLKAVLGEPNKSYLNQYVLCSPYRTILIFTVLDSYVMYDNHLW
jgi:hypothetical protein